MKKPYLLLCMIALCYAAPAQVWLGVYGFRSATTHSLRPEIGGGFAFNLMSKGLATSKAAAAPPTSVTGAKFQIQYGMNFYWSGLGHRTFYNVPLAFPQAGLAKVRLQNSFFGINALARLSLASKSIFTPYGETYLGYRGTFTTMNVDPYVNNYGYEEESDKTLASATGINFGLGGGVTTHLNKSKRIRLDVGVSYIEQLAAGHYVDLSTASAGPSGMNLNLKSAPGGILMLNVGLLFYIEGDDTGDDDCNCKCKHRNRAASSAWIGTGRGGWNGGRSNNVNVRFGGGIKVK